VTGAPVIGRATVWWLGLAQLVSWGITYYLIGGFGEAIAADLGWSRGAVHGGFSAALLAMALVSPVTGRWIDRHGGRRVMTLGALVTAAGCAGLALCRGPVTYYAAWIALGVAMRLALYDAAFAALARIAGAGARRAMAQITLLGGLASIVFWPLGHAIAERVGWRGALWAYAGFALLTVPMYRAIPDVRGERERAAAPPVAAQASAVRHSDPQIAGALYALSAVLVAFLNAGMSAHMIGILHGLGIAAPVAVWVATLRGVGQSLARLAEVVFGRRIGPLALNLAASGLLPVCFAAGMLGGASAIAALGFAFVYGASNGLLTITRGTLPLLLFDAERYGTVVGRLLVPSFLASSAAPVIYAAVIGRIGERGALWMSLGAGAAQLGVAAALRVRFRHRQR